MPETGGERIIPFFIMNSGCPHRCIFCNERIAAGDYPQQITKESFFNTVEQHLGTYKPDHHKIQIAFYGGNFTGMPEERQVELLSHAGYFIEKGLIHSVRISTRPDYIDRHALSILKDHSVRTVEIGAQSMSDRVLEKSNRGHSAGDIRNATALLRENGFETGIHLMAGLPGDSREGFMRSVGEIAVLRPDMVRIHPVIVFENTVLAELYRSGQYMPLSLDEAVEQCKLALDRFSEAGIRVIRLGLQMTPGMEKAGAVVAGPFHPAFRSLVEGSRFLDKALGLIDSADLRNCPSVTFYVSRQDESDFRGIRSCNIRVIRQRIRPSEMKIVADPAMGRGALIMHAGENSYSAC